MPRFLRVLLPAVLILGWLAAGAVSGPLFGRVSDVSVNAASTFLPKDAEATEVQNRLSQFLGDDAIPAVVVITHSDGTTPIGRVATAEIQEALAGVVDQVPDALSASPVIASDDGVALQLFVELNAQAATSDAVAALESFLDTALAPLSADFDTHVTGPAGFSADLASAFAGIDGLLLMVALVTVLIILVIVYRAPLLALAVLVSALLALCAALGTVWVLAREGVVLFNGQTQGILFILVIGAATDYGLLYVARYREELKLNADRFAATKAALRGAFEPIVASGGTVIAGLLCLLLSKLGSNHDLGPIAAIGIAFAMLSALTLLPAFLVLAGRVAYWPKAPKPAAAAESGTGQDETLPTKGIWHALPPVVARHPRRIWVGVFLALVVATLGSLSFRASGVAQSELALGASDARDGQKILAAHFPAGSGNPVQVVIPAEQRDTVAAQLATHAGVASVAMVAEVPGGVLRYSDGVFSPGEPTVVEGQVLLQATLTDAFDSAEATETVKELRADLGEDALIGGTTATDLDTDTASARDRTVIIPVVLVVIAIILALLLRSIVAPLLLMATTVLSFGATLGVSALVFNHLLGFPGADPALPLFAFVFLVALGVDYNIFLMTRVREETLKYGTQVGVSRGLGITGGVITSAGLVLAATFAALGVVPVLFLAQIAFIVAFGVLLDTFVVRSLLLPALVHDIGRRVWWPSALSHGRE